MSTHSHDLRIPSVPLVGGAALVAVTVLAVAAVRMSGVEVSSRSTAPVVAERALFFFDQDDGGVEVREADRVIERVPPSQHGFLRGTVRALVRERRLAGVGADVPFHLKAHADGRLTLDDPSTGRRVDLDSFGPTNAEVFARLLASRPLPASPMAR
jgi:putative photosynthetic complex assembly protein